MGLAPFTASGHTLPPPRLEKTRVTNFVPSLGRNFKPISVPAAFSSWKVMISFVGPVLVAVEIFRFIGSVCLVSVTIGSATLHFSTGLATTHSLNSVFASPSVSVPPALLVTELEPVTLLHSTLVATAPSFPSRTNLAFAGDVVVLLTA